MLNYLLRGVLATVAVTVLDRYRQLSGDLLRVETAKGYLHGVRLARRSAIGLVKMGLLTGLICLGALLVHAGLFFLLPWGVKAKALIGLALGAAYMAAGLLALRAAMAERTWVETSGAADLLKAVTRHAKG